MRRRAERGASSSGHRDWQTTAPNTVKPAVEEKARARLGKALQREAEIVSCSVPIEPNGGDRISHHNKTTTSPSDQTQTPKLGGIVVLFVPAHLSHSYHILYTE